MKMNLPAIVTVLFFSVWLSCGQSAFATPGDYDGDGIADLAIIDADPEEDKTTVFVQNSSDGSESAFVFHPFGNYVISGSFFGGNRTFPGIVSVPDIRNVLDWRIKMPSGQELVFSFGERNDQVPNQGDLDCDGKADFVVVRTRPNGSRLWLAKLTTRPNAVRKVSFGKRPDFVFTADIDGDGCSEIGVLSPKYIWSTRPFSAPDVSTVQWGKRGDVPLPPLDLTNDGVPDYLVVRAKNGKFTALIHTIADGNKKTRLGTSESIPMAGNFTGTNDFAWFVPQESRFFLRNSNNSVATESFGNPRRGVVRPEGSDVPEGQRGNF